MTVFLTLMLKMLTSTMYCPLLQTLTCSVAFYRLSFLTQLWWLVSRLFSFHRSFLGRRFSVQMLPPFHIWLMRVRTDKHNCWVVVLKSQCSKEKWDWNSSFRRLCTVFPDFNSSYLTSKALLRPPYEKYLAVLSNLTVSQIPGFLFDPSYKTPNHRFVLFFFVWTKIYTSHFYDDFSTDFNRFVN